MNERDLLLRKITLDFKGNTMKVLIENELSYAEMLKILNDVNSDIVNMTYRHDKENN